jgi:antitoxin (DNA-binding transcriptional repressor) of toxin-antitoxin stability system
VGFLPFPFVSNRATETVTVRQLRSDWVQIKRRIARGEQLILTDNGKPIMQLLPLERQALSRTDLGKHWKQQLARAKEIMSGRPTGDSTVLEERATSN